MALYVWHDCGYLQRHILDRSRRGKQQYRSRLTVHLSRDCSKRLRYRATYVGGSAHIFIYFREYKSSKKLESVCIYAAVHALGELKCDLSRDPCLNRVVIPDKRPDL